MRWEVLLSISLGLHLLPGLCSGVTVTQKERFVMIQAGANASIPCQHDDSTFLYFYWYRQEGSPTETGLQLIGYSAQGNDPVMEMDKTKFTIDRPNVNEASLVITAAQMADAAGYFCAASQKQNNYPLNFGQGTRLTVLEPGQEPTLPKVTIFAPSQKEIEEKQAATLVCLATDFIPDHVNISWYLYGTRITEGVKTEEFSKYHSETKSYSLTSRLRVSKQKWQDSYNQFQCKVKFYVNDTVEVYGSVISSEGCDTERVTYQREGYIGRFVYILLILKSTLYGVFVMSLMLRKKSVQ